MNKLIYRHLCDQRIPWDKEILDLLKIGREHNKRKTLGPIHLAKESITAVDLHAFGDASIFANCAAVYTIVYNSIKINQG